MSTSSNSFWAKSYVELKSEQKDYYLSRIPMSRFGKPVDIANIVFFLAGDESSYITGQNFHVNGGMLMV